MEISLYKQFLVILLLTVGNGIFSMLEMSIVSSHQSRLESMAEEGNKSAKIVLKLRENPNKMFSTVQFGMTLVSLLTGVYGGTEMAGPPFSICKVGTRIGALCLYNQHGNHCRCYYIFNFDSR